MAISGISPKSFKAFVKEINNLKNILGNLNKRLNDEEKGNQASMRRKIVSNKNLKKNYKIRNNDLLIVRSQEPGIFLSEINWE